MTFWQITLELLEGLGTTSALFFLTLLFALPLGLIICFGSMSRFAPLKYVTKTIVWIVRSVPLMLQLFIVFYVPGMLFNTPFRDIPFPLFGEDFTISSRFLASLIAFVINYACYFSEIYRGGIEGVPLGQYEAGQVLGMSKRQVFSQVIFMQVIKRILAPMSNEVITLVKDTALARVIGVIEIIKIAERFMNTQAIIWPLFYTAVFYLAFVGILTLLFGYLEKKQSYYKI